MGLDGTQAGAGGILVVLAGMVGAFFKSVWNGVQDYIKLRRSSDEDKEAAKATIISLAQSQMNDTNNAMWRQVESLTKQVEDLTKDNRLLRSDLRDAQATIGGLQDRVRELEK